MAEMEEKLGAILNNPQLMQQIMSLAQTMGQSAPSVQAEKIKAEAPSAPSLDPAMLNKLAGLSSAGTDSNQKALLSALNPYVHKEKLNRLERAMQAAKLAQLAASFLGSNGLAALTGR